MQGDRKALEEKPTGERGREQGRVVISGLEKGFFGLFRERVIDVLVLT